MKKMDFKPIILTTAILITLLTIFTIGYYFGTQSNDRYFKQNKNNQIAIFDKRTGKIFVKSMDEYSDKVDYFTIDVINADETNYKKK